MIFRKISFWIVEAVYPLIPSLYDIFQILAENRFFTEDQIANLSNNIYIFISVCMLFAFGIRLLNGIVNPDLLDEKKKGVKSVFFNAFAAVIMIIIVPFGFKLLYSIQDRIIENHLIEKIFLGTELTDKQDPGQIIAAYAFSAFCYPNEEVTSEGLDSTGQDYYNKTLTDISNVKKLTGYINEGKGLGKNREYDLEYNSILAPAAGLVILYELIIMCIDLALRSVKLGLLQLIAPIILCGYIFKGTELLQKWIKEVITTWVLLFLKVAMVVFMVYGLALLPGFLDKIEFPDGSGKITKGLVKMFILIGLLQVIKQLPNIINSVFGTNIQSRGGIKGRLGEMAAVGGMAQNGWSALGNKVKGVGIGAAKLGALAYTGVKGLAVAGGAAAAGIGIKKAWNKGIGNTGPLKDTKAGKVARTAGAGIKATGAGLAKKGGLFASIAEGTKAFNETDIGKTLKASRTNKNRSGAFNNFKIDDNGRLNPFNIIQNKLASNAINTAQASGMRKKAADDEFNSIDEKIKNTYKNSKGVGVAKEIIDKQREFKDSAVQKSHADLAKKKYDAVNDTIDSMINRASSEGNDTLSKKLSDLKSDFVTGKVKMTGQDSLLSKINDLKVEGVTDGDYSKLKADAGSFQKALDAKIQIHDDKGNAQEISISSLIPKTSGGGFVITDLGDTVTAITKDFETKKGQIDKKMNELNYGDEQKEIINSVTDSIVVTTDSLASANSKFDSGNRDQVIAYNNYSSGNQLPVPPASSSSPAPSSQPTQQPLPSSGSDATQNTQSSDNSTNTNSSGGESSTASNPEHQKDGSYVAGIYSAGGAPAQITGDVNANVDLSSLEKGLEAINNSVNSNGQNITKAVNNQGNNITRKLQETNKHLGSIDTGIGNMSSSISDLGSSLNKKDDDDDE